MDKRGLKPQMGFCSPPAPVRKDSARKKLLIDQTYSSSGKSMILNFEGKNHPSISRKVTTSNESVLNATPAPKTMAELFGGLQSNKKKPLSRSSIASKETVFMKPLLKPMTLAELLGLTIAPKSAVKVLQKDPVQSVKKPLPFQNIGESCRKSTAKRFSPRNHRKSITAPRLSSVTKTSSHYSTKDMNGDIKHSSGKKKLFGKYSESKRSAIKQMTVDEVTSTSIPRISKLRQGTGNINIKKSLCFHAAPNTEKENTTDIIHENSLEEMTGIIPLRRSIAKCENNKDSIAYKYQLTKATIQETTTDKSENKVALAMLRSSIKKNNSQNKSSSSHCKKTPKRLRFNKSPMQENDPDFSSMPNITVTDDSFMTHERACKENTSTKPTCPIGISTPFRQYRTVDTTFDQSAISNCSLNKVSPMLVPQPDGNETIREEDDNNSSAFNTLCEMMEGTKLQQVLHPKCLNDLNSAKTAIINEMMQLKKQLEMKQNALEHIENAIKVITDSNSIFQKQKNKIISKKINSQRCIVWNKENVQRRVSDITELPKRTHRMDLRKRVLSNTLMAQSDENASPLMDVPQPSRQMYLNLKKNNMFLKTPNGKESRVLTEQNSDSPTTIISSNLQKQLHLLYD